MNITQKIFTTAAMLAGSLTASVISSADPLVTLDSGTPVIVQSPPANHAPWVWPNCFTYISNQDSGYLGTNGLA